MAVTVSAGCSSHVPSPTTVDGDARPVPECVALDIATSACTRQPSAIALQPEALATSGEERKRLAGLCSANLARLRRGCL
jgi:hypothetical protein